MRRQIHDLFKVFSRAGVGVTSDMVRVVTKEQLELVAAKNTQGKFFNAASWVSAVHQTMKVLFQRRLGGDPGGKDFEKWKQDFHSSHGKQGGRPQYCGSSVTWPL